jgi:DegV family protein with EDD domain
MKIVTDCAANLTADEAKALDIQVAPLYIQFPEGEMDSNDLTPDEFYQRLKNMAPLIPTTAQPSSGIFTNIYKKLLDNDEEIISIHVSSGLSGTLGSAQVGAAQFPVNLIQVVDSKTLSGGQRFQVLAAALAAAAGRKEEFILERLSKIRQATEVVFTLETLEYLQRGGRIGRVQALAGALLHIKPIIHVDRSDGKYSTIGKERTIAKSMSGICDYIEKEYGTQTPMWVTVIHGQIAEEANTLAALIQEKVNVAKLETLRVSPVLGVHTGPGIVGLAAVPMNLMEELG